jgi:uncharacterized protein (TIGR02145 family)
MKFIKYILFLLLSVGVLTIYSCKKEKEDPEPPTSENPISHTLRPAKGIVVLPAGATINLSGWSVNSGLSVSTMVNDSFNLPEVSTQFSLIFASDENDRERLMGLAYPGQTDFTINSSTTVLAMLMKMPSVISLTPQGQLKLINSIRSSALFNEAVTEFEFAFTQNKDLFDTTNTVLSDKLSALFESASLRIAETNSNSTVNIIRAGRTVIVQNPGKPYAQRVGIYRGQELVNSFTLGRYQFFSGSISELINAVGNPPEPIQSNPYTFQGDGEFYIKVRTGKPFSGINDDLSKEAFKENMFDVVTDYVSFYLPKKPNAPCLSEIRDWTISEVDDYVGLLSQTSGNANSLTSIIYQVAESSVTLIETSASCSSNLGNASFYSKIKKFLRFVNKVKAISQTLNTSLFVYRYLADPAKSDTCFNAQGNIITTCGGCGTTTSVTDASGNTYPVVQIGNQCWTKENLRTSKYADGSVIPNVTSDAAWTGLSSGAWCNYENNAGNDAIYGKLYNWYTVADPRNVCPTGWHVPTNAEWYVLTDFLGGQFVAGGKMKTTSGWQAPNTSATNESGFSGLPGGFHYYDGGFFNVGNYGYWWSSSEALESTTNGAWFRYLYYDESGIGFQSPYDKQSGFSVRCLRD